MTIPTLHTNRLTLSAPTRADFVAYAAMLGDPRTAHMGGPFSRADAWNEFCKLIASWHLDGFGGWLIRSAHSTDVLGEICIAQQDNFPEPELGWTLSAQAEGHGYAHEAATAALRWYWANTDADTLVSYITPGNARSEALAKKLGATPDALAPLPTGETRADTTVFRHTRNATPSLFQENPPRRADRPNAGVHI